MNKTKTPVKKKPVAKKPETQPEVDAFGVEVVNRTTGDYDLDAFKIPDETAVDKPTRIETQENIKQGKDENGQYTIQNSKTPGYQFNREKAKAIIKASVSEAIRLGLRVDMKDFAAPTFLSGVTNDGQLVGRIIAECLRLHNAAASSGRRVTAGVHKQAPSGIGFIKPKPKSQHNFRWKCPSCGTDQQYDENDCCCVSCGYFPPSFTDLLYEKTPDEVTNDE